MGKNTAEQDNPSLTVRLSKNELGLDKGESIEQPVKIVLGNLNRSKVSKIFAGNSKIIIASKQFAKKSKNVEYLEYRKKIFLRSSSKIF